MGRMSIALHRVLAIAWTRNSSARAVSLRHKIQRREAQADEGHGDMDEQMASDQFRRFHMYRQADGALVSQT